MRDGVVPQTRATLALKKKSSRPQTCGAGCPGSKRALHEYLEASGAREQAAFWGLGEIENTFESQTTEMPFSCFLKYVRNENMFCIVMWKQQAKSLLMEL